MSGGGTVGKAICSICYEDLKPIVEDLQAISICGHVFHELCLQQWFEYCSGTKKTSCPVCKQTCPAKDVSRLYFQSVGDAADDSILSQRLPDLEEDSEAVRRERKRLEAKVLGLSSALERHQKDLKELAEELSACKEAAKKETASKNDAMRQNASIKQILHLKSEELQKSTMECSRLQGRNMALAKELAALKLVTDLNLEEEDVLKFASLGNDGNNKDTIDVLRRSLVIRNKNYTELMAKCNLLGRGEARYHKKLDKAKEKIKKLKTRVQELETAIEIKENKVLRVLKKASKRAACEGVFPGGINAMPTSFLTTKDSLEDQQDKLADQIGSLKDDPDGFKGTQNFVPLEDIGADSTKDYISATALDGKKDSYVLVDKDSSETSAALHGLDAKLQISEDADDENCSLSRLATAPDMDKVPVHRATRLSVPVQTPICEKDMVCDRTDTMKKEIILLDDDTRQGQPVLHIKKENPSSALNFQSGSGCFSTGLLGPDGTPRYLGKWCKRVQSNRSITSSASMQGSLTNSGDLIAVGADGRGGRIKVLRSLKDSSADSNGNSVPAKRCKYGANTSTLQSKGCLQIEHFFGKSQRFEC